jgi:rare lipoprotein A
MVTGRLQSLWRVMPMVLMMCLGACAETELVANTAKQLSVINPSPKARYKVGDPYQIKGVWYYPQVDYNYDETGIASWYGAQFQGRLTANGEIFDMNEVSAAHRTLPMPSMVRVTNLENGRSIELRINDRGPFAHGRIIDLSRRSAQLLGFFRQGTARVRVTLLPKKSRRLAALAKKGRIAKVRAEVKTPVPAASPSTAVASTALKVIPGTSVAVAPKTAVPALNEPKQPPQSAVAVTAKAARSVILQQPVKTTKIFVQAGAFSSVDNATRLKTMLNDVGDAGISQVKLGGKSYYRVRIGPLENVAVADRVLDEIIARGYPGARVIVD